MRKEVLNMERTTPEKLFVCISKMRPTLAEALDKFYTEGTPVPADLQAIREKHLHYVYDLGERGIVWLGGPSADLMTGLNIYAVDSVEEARKAQQNDPYYANELWYDDEYFEWIVHAPLDMVAPIHKERLENSYRALGIIP
jgi:uncharacterized protein YciI